MKEERQLRTMRELKVKLKTFLLDVELVPKELIFIGRAMRILQANNQAMGKIRCSLNRIGDVYFGLCFSRFACQQTEHTGAACIFWFTEPRPKRDVLTVTDHSSCPNTVAFIREGMGPWIHFITNFFPSLPHSPLCNRRRILLDKLDGVVVAYPEAARRTSLGSTREAK